MQLDPGVFISNLETDDWEPDPEVGGESHMLCSNDGTDAGLWRLAESTKEPTPYTHDRREILLVLEGSVRIEIKGASTLELKQGDMVSIPKGAETLWHVTAPFKEFWIMA